MIRDIVLYGDPVLRVKCPPVTEFTAALTSLAADMIETMHAAQGVGLAAPQIGETLRLAVVDVSGVEHPCTFLKIDGQEAVLAEHMPLKFTNPQLSMGKEKVIMNEGCLSFPELRTEIRRGDRLKAHLTLLDGRTIFLETDGLLSRAIQHETDHLNGILFIDRATPAAKLSLKKKIHKMWDEYGGE